MTQIAPMPQRFLPLFLLLTVFLSLAAPQCLALEAPPDLATPLRVKIVEIKGAKVRLPIPDGYEEMLSKDEGVLIYAWMMVNATGGGRIPLAYFINSSDKKKFKKDDERIRHAVAFADPDYFDLTISKTVIDGKLREALTIYIKNINDLYNDIQNEMKESEYAQEIIYSKKKSISASFKRHLFDKKNNMIEEIILSFILLDQKLVEIHFHKFKDIESSILIRDTENYLVKINQGCF